MKRCLIFVGILILGLGLITPVLAQQADTSTKRTNFKNTVRFNISAPIIFGDRYLVIGYERMVKPNQSFSINIGSYGLPDFIESDSLKVSRSNRDKGFHFSADYRFYLAKENKYPAPHGIYIGPFYSFNHLLRENNWTFNTAKFKGNTSTSFNLNIHTIGIELGYQFIFWNRLTVDIVAVGPGIGYYDLQTTINTDLQLEQKNQVISLMAKGLKEKIPGGSHIIDEDKFKRNSGFSSWAIGYRYIAHVGFRF